MPKEPVAYLKHILILGIDYTIVWDVVRNKIPELSRQVAEVIRSEENFSKKRRD